MVFTNGQESQQKGKITGYERIGEGTKVDKITINYIRTDNDSNQASTASKLTSNFSNEEKEMLKSAAKNGDELVLVKVFAQKEGASQGFWNLKEIKAASTFTAKPKPAFNKPAFNGGGGGNSFATKTPYNEAGVKVGATLHDAVAIVVAQQGTKTSVEQVGKVARELLKLSMALEQEVKSGEYNKPNESKPSQETKTITQSIKADSSLDDLDDDFDPLEIEL